MISVTVRLHFKHSDISSVLSMHKPSSRLKRLLPILTHIASMESIDNAKVGGGSNVSLVFRVLAAVTKAVSISDSSTFCFRGFCSSYLTSLVEYCLRLNIQNDVLYQVFLVNSIKNVMWSRKNVKDDHDATGRECQCITHTKYIVIFLSKQNHTSYKRMFSMYPYCSAQLYSDARCCCRLFHLIE